MRNEVKVRPASSSIKMSEMKLGQFARIVDTTRQGEIVFCTWGPQAISLSTGVTWSWEGDEQEISVLVEIIPPGSVIEITVGE